MIMTPWSVTFGPGFHQAKIVAKNLNESIKLSDTWKEEFPSQTPLLKVVSKRAPNIKDILFKRKSIALKPQTSLRSPVLLLVEKRREVLLVFVVYVLVIALQ